MVHLSELNVNKKAITHCTTFQLNSSKDPKPEQGQCSNKSVVTGFTVTAAAMTVSTLTMRMANFQALEQRAIPTNMFGQHHAIGQS